VKWKEGSLKLATSRLIVLWVMDETKDPSHATVQCPNLLLSDFTKLKPSKMGEHGVFPLRRHPKRRGRMARWEVPPADLLHLMHW